MITSIAKDRDKLWVAYGDQGGESGLGLYNPKKEEWESVFCSTLKSDSPFNNGQPYHISSLVLNSNKLFFTVKGLDSLEQWKSDFWKIDLNSRKLKYIRPLSGEFLYGSGNNIMIQSSSYLIDFNPVSESMRLLLRDSKRTLKRYPQRGDNIYGLEEDIFVPESFLDNVVLGPYYAQGNLDLATGAIHNNKLWARLGRYQILIIEKGKSFEEAQIIDNDILDGKPVIKFVSTPYGLVGIGEGVVGLIETGD